jgi:CRP-like cAMP-binding protein
MHHQLYAYFSERSRLDEATFARIRPYFVPEIYPKNTHLLNPGETCRFIYFVYSGCLRFYSVNQQGQELTRYFGFEGKLGTALTSFIEQKPSFEYIQCLEPTEVLVVSHTDFYRLVDTIPQVNAIYRNILEMAYITSQKRIYGLQGETALERLRWLLHQQPTIFQRIPSRVIASYLGITRYTLSRLKSEL